PKSPVPRESSCPFECERLGEIQIRETNGIEREAEFIFLFSISISILMSPNLLSNLLELHVCSLCSSMGRDMLSVAILKAVIRLCEIEKLKCTIELMKS